MFELLEVTSDLFNQFQTHAQRKETVTIAVNCGHEMVTTHKTSGTLRFREDLESQIRKPQLCYGSLNQDPLHLHRSYLKKGKSQ